MEKINIAELLKDCPKGMELDCTMYENVYFDKTYNEEDCLYPIGCYIIGDNNRNSVNFTKYGEFNYHSNAKCIIFPKGKTTWDGFTPPCKFKDGDIVISDKGDIHLLRTKDSSYCAYRKSWGEFPTFDSTPTTCVKVVRLATEEEKQKLFQAIKDNGYRWNTETKTLEKLIKPEFKIGDRIRHKTNTRQENVVTEIKDTHYILDDESALPFIFQDQYVIIPNKFDINTLKPFDKVLIRDTDTQEWSASLFSHCDELKFHKYICINGCGYAQCIPYEVNKELLGTTNNPKEYGSE